MPYLDISLRLFLAAVLAGMIGYEREKDRHPAGFRTHILVSVGAALIMLVSAYGFQEFLSEANVRFDPSRIGAQVVSGVGFLGAGAIVRQGLTVNGLTTAASLWVVAGIGLAVGAGFIFGATLATVFVLISLEVLNRFDRLFQGKQTFQSFELKLDGNSVTIREFTELIGMKGGAIHQLEVDQSDEQDRFILMRFTVKLPSHASVVELCEEMRKLEGVISIQTDEILYERESEMKK